MAKKFTFSEYAVENDILMFPVKVVAKLAGCSKELIYERIKMGQLPCVKVGRSRKLNPIALDEFFNLKN